MVFEFWDVPAVNPITAKVPTKQKSAAMRTD